MTNKHDDGLPNFANVITNWNRSDLSFFRRLGVALANYGRRFGIPPKSCCGNHGQPGC